jgi:hypothetical protein
MLAAADAGQSVVAAILALGTAGLGGAIVAMVWSLQLAQIQRGGRLDGQRAGGPTDDALPDSRGPDSRGPDSRGPDSGGPSPGMPAPGGTTPNGTTPGVRGNGDQAMVANGNGAASGHGAPRPSRETPALTAQAQAQAGEVHRPGPAAPSVIEGPDSVVIGEQARYRVRHSAAQQVVAWAAGGGAVSQASDPAHPDDLLLVADRPGTLTVSVRLREGLAERREIKAVTAVASQETAVPAVVSRLLLQDWPIVTVAVLVAGFAAALVALGSLGVGDFIALVAPLTAVLAVVAATRGSAGRPGR